MHSQIVIRRVIRVVPFLSSFSIIRAVAVAFLLVSTTHEARADCGQPGVKIIGSLEEQESACEALLTVMTRFRNLGYEFEPVVTIRFRDRVFCNFGSNDSRDECLTEVSGFYDFRRKLVEITSADSPFREDRRPWGMKWGKELSFSILQHELAHMSIGEILGTDFANLSQPWHELLAYAIQFDLMDPAMRDEILRTYRSALAFERPEQVNPLIHAMDPDAFAVRSYLYMKENGGDALIRDILARTSDWQDDGASYLWTP
jgi:hypothetical protein